jgi:hypothetical protein
MARPTSLKLFPDGHVANTQVLIWAKLWAAADFRSAARGSGQVWQEQNDTLAGNVEPPAQVVPERRAVLGAGLGEAEEGIAAISSSVTTGSSADLPADQLTAEVVFRTGTSRSARPSTGHAGRCRTSLHRRSAPRRRAGLLAAIVCLVGWQAPSPVLSRHRRVGRSCAVSNSPPHRKRGSLALVAIKQQRCLGALYLDGCCLTALLAANLVSLGRRCLVS